MGKRRFRRPLREIDASGPIFSRRKQHPLASQRDGETASQFQWSRIRPLEMA